LDDLRDVATRRLDLDGDRDCVAVILDEAYDRKLERARGTERLPEFSLAGRPVADRHVGHFARRELRDPIGNLRDLVVETACFRAADRLQALRARRTRLRDDVQAFVSPV